MLLGATSQKITFFNILKIDPSVEAKVDKYAEIEYSMVGSPVISNASIDIGLKVILNIISQAT